MLPYPSSATPSEQDRSAKPFAIQVPESQLRALVQRLDLTRWPDQIADVGWRHGTNLESLRGLVTYWRTDFDWRRQEAALNAIPQFTARIGDDTLHFIWLRSGVPGAAPLVLTHGWPSTCFEMRRVLPLLTNPRDPRDAFDVVAPSVPGYGFSSRPATPGVESRTVAGVINALMTEVLGYSSYFAHGGDIGAGITSALAYYHPKNVRGIHLTAVRDPVLDDGSPPFTVAERVFLEARQRWSEDEGGYSHLQRTRPQTLAYALNDSPTGLLAWMVEKFRAWSDCEGELERRFSKDDVLTIATIYWVTETIGSSMRYYAASRENPWTLGRGERIRVPTAVAMFPKDLSLPPREWAERTYHVA
ncbi:MAG TPA: epoxide hydrolase, partial [Vicinamibacterales bacterium]|nr:epoxide hydrolase [Vicinamibacterales bacterium]